MSDKMAITAHILKIVENDPFLRLKRQLRKCLIVTNFFPTNKQYLNIKLMQNETNLWSSLFGKDEILLKL